MPITAVYAMSKSPFEVSLISLKSHKCKSSVFLEIHEPLHISLNLTSFSLVPRKKRLFEIFCFLSSLLNISPTNSFLFSM